MSYYEVYTDKSGYWRASPMDVDGEREGFAELKLALAALYVEEVE